MDVTRTRRGGLCLPRESLSNNLDKLPGLLDSFANRRDVEGDVDIVITPKTLIKRIQQPSMKLRIEVGGFREVLSESGVDGGVLPIPQVPFSE